MNLLANIKIKNFKCFRNAVEFPLSQGTYFVGVNNAGKTAILNAIRFFFDNTIYNDDSFLNKTEYLAKKASYNKSELSISFNFNAIESKVLKYRLVKIFGNETGVIKKNITFTPDSKKMSLNYEINGSDRSFDELDGDIKKLLTSVKITYIHPQEGKELFLNAQSKLRERLLANWGRGAKLSHSIMELQERWDGLRGQAHNYLSTSLTESLQKMWPGSQAAIDLPKNIKELVAISDINFKSNLNLPEIELTSQGTGVQTTILYLVHYLLDSDRSLHRGEYHAVWLLEEPESFLHADLIAKFAGELNSKNWLKNIQMMISTHSAIILASSRLVEKNIIWNLIQNYSLKETKNVEMWTEEEILNIGNMMGDTNFHIYFSAARNDKIVFLEDKKKIVKQKFEESGIKIENGLEGVSNIIKYIEVLLNFPDLIKQSVYFIIDNDFGSDELSRFLPENPAKIIGRFKLYKIKKSNNLYIITLPEGFSAENLFNEFDNHLDNCISKIWDTTTWKLRELVPGNLTRAHSRARSRNDIDSSDKAKKFIKNESDIKDIFWKEVSSNN